MWLPERFQRVRGEHSRRTAWFVGKQGRKWVRVKSLIYPALPESEHLTTWEALHPEAGLVTAQGYQLVGEWNERGAWEVTSYIHGDGTWALMVSLGEGSLEEIYCRDFPAALAVLNQLAPLTALVIAQERVRWDFETRHCRRCGRSAQIDQERGLESPGWLAYDLCRPCGEAAVPPNKKRGKPDDPAS